MFPTTKKEKVTSAPEREKAKDKTGERKKKEIKGTYLEILVEKLLLMIELEIHRTKM